MQEPTEAELRAFFGPRANYYLAQWRGTARRQYNLAAFLVSGFWLPFRRLYRHAAVFWGLAIGLTILDQVASTSLGRPATPKPIELLMRLAFASTCGIFGNSWYLTRARAAISNARSKALPAEQHLEQLAKAGGTSAWRAAAFTMGVFVIAFVLAVVLGTMGLV